MSKMTLQAVTSGRIKSPIKTAIYGPAGVGNSTFAAGAPGAIFLPVEEGTNAIDCARFPMPETFNDVLDAIGTLATGEHKYKTLVIDTLDALEALIWQHVCAAGKKQSIEDFGYGKGYVAALEQWRIFLSRLEGLRKARSMSIVLVAHSQIRKFQNPEGADFDRYELKLAGKGASGLVTEWSDCLLFACYETVAAVDKNERTRGVTTGKRIARTVHGAAYEAKNRYSLPDPMDLEWGAYREALMRFHTDGGADATAAKESK